MRDDIPDVIHIAFAKRLNGTDALPKALSYLPINKILSFAEYGFFIVLTSLAIYSRQSANYTNANFTISDLAREFKLSKRTIRNYINSLKVKGFIDITKGRKYIHIRLYTYLFERRFPNDKEVNKEELVGKMHSLLRERKFTEKEIIGILEFDIGCREKPDNDVNLNALNDKRDKWNENDENWINYQQDIEMKKKGGNELP